MDDLSEVALDAMKQLKASYPTGRLWEHGRWTWGAHWSLGRWIVGPTLYRRMVFLHIGPLCLWVHWRQK